LSTACDLDKSAIDTALAEIDYQEKNLYQQIVKMFLGRDVALLQEIDKNVQALSEPFCKLLAQVATVDKVDPAITTAIETANVEITRLRGESERLTEQLSMAMQTMDEVSSEYSKMFGASKDAEELDVSRERMLNTYKRAEEKMREAFMEQTIEELESEEL
jgi:HPt (histidine-containing phosphotransfer) domain-containing protein